MRTLAIIAVTLGTALVAPVAHAAYPIEELIVAAPTGTLKPSGTFTATANDCIDGETVTFLVVATGATNTDTCEGGSASAELPTPDSSGTYVVQASGSQSGQTANTQIVVGSGALPRTGSDSNTLLRTGLIASAFGAVLVGVAAIRRRKPRLA
ncbi:MAG: hypothetical protein ABMA25_10010 [Ilumatobacteraceae bacterium]